MSLDLALSKDHERLREAVRVFAKNELAPHSKRWDAENRIPWDSVRKMGAAGLLGIISPAELGGQGRDYVSLGIVIEELARADISSAIICWLQATMGTLIPGWGEEIIREVNAGKKLICLATSEEHAGSDVSNMQTTARRDGDEYIVNGEKIHVSLVPGAHFMGVSANVAEPGSKPSITLFRVPTDSPGVSCSSMEQMGARAHQLGRVTLTNVRVPVSNIIGADGSGKRQMNIRFNVSRCLSPLAAIGAAQATLDVTIGHVKKHKVFGRPIGTNQSISFPLVEHYTRLDAAKLLAYQALKLNGLGQPAIKEAAMAKWFGITSAVQAISDCLQMHGANGYLTEFPIEQRLRDVNALLFTGGTINVMKILLVREFLGREFTGIN